MGTKRIWNGNQVPEKGDEVLIHLASCNAWEKYTVEGFHIWPHLEGESCYHRIFIDVYRMDGGQRVKNSRLLKDVRPIDWRDGDPYNPTGEVTK